MVLVVVIALVLSMKTKVLMFNPTQEDLEAEMDSIREDISVAIFEAGDEPIRRIALQGGYLETPANTFRSYNDYSVSYLCYSIEDSPRCRNRMLTKQDMETQLAKTIDFSLQDTVGVKKKKLIGYEVIVEKDWNVIVEINKDNIVVKLDYPVTLKSSRNAGVSVTEDEFSNTFRYPLGDLYDVSQDILDIETTFGEFDQFVYMLNKKGVYRIEKIRPYPDKLYILNRRDKEDYKFQFAIQGESTLI